MGPQASTLPDIWSPPWKTLLFRTWLTLMLRDIESETDGFGVLIVKMFWDSYEQRSWKLHSDDNGTNFAIHSIFGRKDYMIGALGGLRGLFQQRHGGMNNIATLER